MRRRTKLSLGVAGLVTVLVTAGLVTRFSSSPAAAAPPVVIVAAGDIACDPAYPDFNTGTGTATGCHEKATSDLVETIKPKAVLALGDIQYVHGTAANYAGSYGPTWDGSRTSPTRSWATTRAEKVVPTPPTATTSVRARATAPRVPTVSISAPGT